MRNLSYPHDGLNRLRNTASRISHWLAVPELSSTVACNLTCNLLPELATLLGRKRDYLRHKHLIPMVREGTLRFRCPKSTKHPHQAYLSANHIVLTGDES